MRSYPSNPNYAPSPGRMLNEHLEHHDMSAAEFARRCGRPADFVQELLSGKAPLNPEIARHIAKEFGGAADTWLAIEKEYRENLARDAEMRAGREAMRGRILFLPRILSRTFRSLGRNHRGLPRQS